MIEITSAESAEKERRLAALGAANTLEYCGSDGQKWAECFVATLKDKNLDATDVI